MTKDQTGTDADHIKASLELRQPDRKTWNPMNADHPPGAVAIVTVTAAGSPSSLAAARTIAEAIGIARGTVPSTVFDRTVLSTNRVCDAAELGGHTLQIGVVTSPDVDEETAAELWRWVLGLAIPPLAAAGAEVSWRATDAVAADHVPRLNRAGNVGVILPARPGSRPRPMSEMIRTADTRRAEQRTDQ